MRSARLAHSFIGLLLAVPGAVLAQDGWHRSGEAGFLGLFGPQADITYHPVRQHLVLFGGMDYPPDFTLEFWQWDGGSWVGLGNDGLISRGAGMAWDPHRGQVISFGGLGFGPNLDLMLAWDEAGWREINPAVKPSKRMFHTMVTDPDRARIVIFGGATFIESGELGDTWEWDGLTWIERHPLNSPPPRLRHAMAYDSARRRMVVFGGTAAKPDGPGRTTYTDTWEWDGEDWTERISPVVPSLDAQRNPRMVYDTARGRTVLVGVNEGRLETWVWSGARWSLENVADEPCWGPGWAMGYDEARQEIVLVAISDSWTTWIYQPPEPEPAGADGTEGRSPGWVGTARRGSAPGPSVVAYGTGMAGTGGIVPRLGTRGGPPYLGNEDFRFELTRALGGTLTSIAGASSPAEQMIGGVKSYVDYRAAARWLFVTTGTPGEPGAGTASLRIPIPMDPSLLGFESHWQAFVLDPAAPRGVSHTHALRVTVIR